MRLLLIAFLTVLASSSASAKPVTLSVPQFVDKTGSSSCRLSYDWWFDHLGDAFQAMAQDHLSNIPTIQVLEREGIHAIYSDEIELVNSDRDTSIKKGGFKNAKYAVIGTVTKYEYCAGKKGGGINVAAVAGLFGATLPDVEVGAGSAKAVIEVQMRIVDVESGRIVQSSKGKGEASSSKFSFDSEFGSYGEAKNTPVGEASDKAIAQAIAKLKVEGLK